MCVCVCVCVCVWYIPAKFSLAVSCDSSLPYHIQVRLLSSTKYKKRSTEAMADSKTAQVVYTARVACGLLPSDPRWPGPRRQCTTLSVWPCHGRGCVHALMLHVLTFTLQAPPRTGWHARYIINYDCIAWPRRHVASS